MRTQAPAQTAAPEWVEALRAGLAPLGNPERAVAEKRYLKSELQFLGTGMPALRKFSGQFLKTHPPLGRAELQALAKALFATQEFELRSVGIAILERREEVLLQADLPWLLALVRASPTWAHVDWLAVKVIGPVVGRSGREGALLRRWAQDPDLWVRRTALLAPLDVLRQGEGDFELFAELAAGMIPEKVFWIRKAIGWVLREVTKKRPERVHAFVLQHLHTLSGLTYREATRNLPPALQQDLATRKQGG